MKTPDPNYTRLVREDLRELAILLMGIKHLELTLRNRVGELLKRAQRLELGLRTYQEPEIVRLRWAELAKHAPVTATIVVHVLADLRSNFVEFFSEIDACRLGGIRRGVVAEALKALAVRRGGGLESIPTMPDESGWNELLSSLNN